MQSPKTRLGDLVFSKTALFAGVMIMLTLAAVSVFLIARSIPAFFATSENASILTSNFWSYVGPLIFGTVWAAILSLILATPLAIGISLFISHYAPRRLASLLGYIVDLLAAVPSVVFGLWGIGVVAPAAQPVFAWLNEHLGNIPVLSFFLGGVVSGTGRTITYRCNRPRGHDLAHHDRDLPRNLSASASASRRSRSGAWCDQVGNDSPCRAAVWSFRYGFSCNARSGPGAR